VTSLYDDLPTGDNNKTENEAKAIPVNRGEKRKSEDEDTNISRIKPSGNFSFYLSSQTES